MKRRLAGEAPLLWLSVSLIIGIIMARYVPMPVPVLPVLAVMVVVSCLLYRFRHLQSAAVLVCFLLLGMCVMQHHQTVAVESQTESRLERSKSFFLQQRSKLLERFSESGIDADAYAVVAAMSLGDKSELTRDLKNTYSVSGASHVLALSGLHLGLIYMLLSLFLPRRRWPALSQLFMIVVVWMFVFLVGMSVSVVRSAVMFTVYGLLSIGNRDKMSVNALAFTAIVMLIWNPSWLFDVGFQMSFMAVLSILLFVPLFENVFSAAYLMEHRWLKWMWGMVAVSCSAQLGVAPLIAYYFGRFSTYFLLTNFIVVPATFLIISLSLVVLLFPSLAYLLLYVVKTLNTILSGIAALPGACVDGLRPTVLQVAMVYVVILCCYLLIGRIKPVVGWKASR
jgi:competence protein ComEC